MNLFPTDFTCGANGSPSSPSSESSMRAAVALRQRDLKFVIGYSSVSHMGFVLLGLATANVLGVSAARCCKCFRTA